MDAEDLYDALPYVFVILFLCAAALAWHLGAVDAFSAYGSAMLCDTQRVMLGAGVDTVACSHVA